MYVKRIGSVLLSSLFMATLLGGCSSKQELKLKSYGPTGIKAGQAFNAQPNGESAIWAETENATPTTVLVLEIPLESVAHSGKSVTALVPKGLYEKPGVYQLYLLDRKSNNKSNEMRLVVKP